MCLEDNYLETVRKLNYIPVGLKNKNFSDGWLLDNTLNNISEKNPYYGEYTFYYWYWKNLLPKKKKEDWIGFCSYRELWGEHKKIKDRRKRARHYFEARGINPDIKGSMYQERRLDMQPKIHHHYPLGETYNVPATV